MDVSLDTAWAGHDMRLVRNEPAHLGSDSGYDLSGMLGHWRLCDPDGPSLSEQYLQRYVYCVCPS